MKLSLLLINIFVVAIVSHSQKTSSHTYYISPQGDDHNTGTTITQQWKTVAKVNSTILHAGDKVLFEADKIFSGTIELDSLDSGAPGNPVTISAYGKGRAVIDAGNSNGFTGSNCSYIKLSRLHIKGSGVDDNKGTGILFNSTQTGKSCKSIVIDNCVAEGFHNFGILISCAEGETVKGFDSVTISHCAATANGEGGISSIGSQTAFRHTNFHITHCTVYLNRGIRSKTDGHSGNGIVMSGVQYMVIDNCLAYENGALNNCTGGGPVGIWMWICKDAVIEHCESHHNHAGLNKDGGGFDIDGGCSNCTIQYNYSHDNEGAGYLLAEYGAGMPFANNTIRFNISQNDGRKNGYGGIAFWGVSDAFKVTNTYVYNNTVYVNDSNFVNNMAAAAVMTMGDKLSRVLVANNVFITAGKARMLNSDTQLDTSIIYFAGNDYYNGGNLAIFNYNNVLLQGIAAWQQPNTAQEIYRGNKIDLSANPFYVAAGGGITNGTGITPPKSLTAYQLLAGKPMLKGIDLKKAFDIDVGRWDFYGNMVTKNNCNTVGAVLQ